MSAAGIAAVNTFVATDVELVAAVRAGDDGAFEELYRRHHPSVGGFVRRHVRDHGRAEDVTQEAFVAALRRLRKTDAPIDFKPWIFEIARNGSIDLYRRGRRAQEVSVDFDSGMAAAEVARLPGPTAPDSSVLDRERFEHLRGALDELSDTHHRIIVMRELEGLSYREIGRRMELSPAAVESALFRARRKLEHEYSQLHTGRRCRVMLTVIARLSEGMESERDRRRLDRHARRCSNCRRCARELGVEPMLARRGLAARVAALLPLPAILRRRPFDGLGDIPTSATTAGGHGIAGPLVAAAGPVGVETAAAVGSKAVAVLATVALVGGGGATFGGAGPLTLPGKGRSAVEQRIAEVQAERRTEVEEGRAGTVEQGSDTPAKADAPAQPSAISGPLITADPVIGLPAPLAPASVGDGPVAPAEDEPASDVPAAETDLSVPFGDEVPPAEPAGVLAEPQGAPSEPPAPAPGDQSSAQPAPEEAATLAEPAPPPPETPPDPVVSPPSLDAPPTEGTAPADPAKSAGADPAPTTDPPAPSA